MSAGYDSAFPLLSKGAQQQRKARTISVDVSLFA